MWTLSGVRMFFALPQRMVRNDRSHPPKKAGAAYAAPAFFFIMLNLSVLPEHLRAEPSQPPCRKARAYPFCCFPLTMT